MLAIVHVTYQKTGKSTSPYGIPKMQQKVFEVRTAQYILNKALLTSGNSRATMFFGLDKLINQAIKSVIVAVLKRFIGNS